MISRQAPRGARHHILLLGLALAAACCATPAAAAEKELLDVLLENEAINQEQYDELLKKEELTKKDVDNVVVTLDKKGFRVSSADGAFKFKLGGRLHAQASTHVGGTPPGNPSDDGTEIRRARIEMQGNFFTDFEYVASVDFADNEVSVKDFFVGYAPTDSTLVTIGDQKQPYSLSLEMSSNDIPFIERSVDNDLNAPFVDRAIGIRGEASGDHWFFAGGVFGESVNPTVGGDEGWGTVARFIYSPIITENQVLHLGVRGAYRDLSGSSSRLRVRAETTHMSNLFLVNTNVMDMIDSATLVGAEAAYAYGPFSAFAEYNPALIQRSGADDLFFDGWHVASALTLTGESRAPSYRIDAGEFKGLSPKNNFSFSERHWGAWEIAGRLAALNLNDEDILGGREKVFTTALNWYLNDSVRFMSEWSTVVDTDHSDDLRRGAKGLNIFQFRTQLVF